MIASTQKTNKEIFTFIAFLVFKLLSRKVFLQTEKARRFKRKADFTSKFLQTYK